MRRARSLRRLLSTWAGVTLGATVIALTAMTVVTERAEIRAVQRAAGESLVGHLVRMPELRRSSREAQQHLATLQPALAAAGAALELVPATAPPDRDALAARNLDLEDGRFVLRYRAEAPWVARIVRAAVAIHVAQGIVAAMVLIGGIEWILRKRLVAPLGRIAHEVRFMGAGGGWSPLLPASDSELADVEAALRALGPALQGQVAQWLEGERRAAVAGAVARLRSHLREPHRRALALAGDLIARDGVTSSGKTRMRALVRELEALTAAIVRLEEEAFTRLAGSDGGGARSTGEAPAPPKG